MLATMSFDEITSASKCRSTYAFFGDDAFLYSRLVMAAAATTRAIIATRRAIDDAIMSCLPGRYRHKKPARRSRQSSQRDGTINIGDESALFYFVERTAVNEHSSSSGK